jgi:ATP-binding cassette subfamily G (WHITE) protein 2 (SNQ2)
MVLLFFLFQDSWGQWICAFAPSFTVISNVLPFFFVTFSLFNGVVRPYAQLNVFWRYFLYYCNPSTYWIGGVIGSTLAGIPIQCSPTELTYFNPPPSQSCSSYTAPYISAAGGYLTNPDATANCGYCQYTDGTQYMLQLNIEPKEKWGYFGIFLGFVVANWVLVYFFIYTVRIRGWSFGFGAVFGGLGKLVGGLKGLFGRKN